jgi:CDP-diacylglycerol--glycerol-3-phosphate 3-phosphatidyltransferase/cardiolipin synthase
VTKSGKNLRLFIKDITVAISVSDPCANVARALAARLKHGKAHLGRWLNSCVILLRYGAITCIMLSLPNILTMSRIFAVPILVFLLWPGTKPFGVQPVPLDYAFAFILYCLMGITDYFDGYLARAQGTVSKLGVFLDPIADKIMVAAVILMLVFTRDVDGWHVIAALVILLREMIVSGLREFLAGLQISVPVSKLAKWKTTFQLVSLGGIILAGSLPDWILLKQAALALLWIAAVLTMITGWDYLRVGIKHMD